GDVRTGEAGLRHPRADRCVEFAPLREKSGGVIALRPQRGPAAESVGLVADLERQEIRADRLRNIGRLVRRLLLRAAREIEAVNEFPSEYAQGRGEAVDVGRRNDDVFRSR